MVLVAGPAGAADLPKAEDCLGCHADKDLKRGTPAPGRSASVFVDAAGLEASAHGALECVACHRTATAPHDDKLPAVSCAGCHDQGASSTCVQCHRVGGVGGNPHPVSWLARHRRAELSTNPMCLACHP